MNQTAHTDVREHILATGQRIIAGKGFSAVGLNEILREAGVPKGSFYHYFSSKEGFGQAMLERYFATYLTALEQTLTTPGLTAAQRLMAYWQQWEETQSFHNCQGKCLAVKLGAEIADLSEAMRQEMDRGISGIVKQLAKVLEAGREDGSLTVNGETTETAQGLYQLWLGASVTAKIRRDASPFKAARHVTEHLLGLSD